ncbi:hypothetical protein B0T17DRAFT_637782 [Bombardia bombarda]|uniref:Ent-kaurene synthase n=1 Tax=Bombardia bombarda TaxID=252184 RepID=A0AA39XBS3_9PEZI|nr:hypothetical protein B0T17DRAFT_637782 [Bombardia bombarda]
MDSSPHQQAHTLIEKLAVQCISPAYGGFGSMTPTIYDTAWLSMVRKTNTTEPQDQEPSWLFPESFDFLLAHQAPSGSWASYASPIDGILNTAAALLSLKKRLKLCPENMDLIHRSHRAEQALRDMLNSDDWDADSIDQVGFEMLIIQHLSLLKEEGVTIDFPQLGFLRTLRDAKLAKLPPSSVYKTPSTLYHSLEALIGHIDFDQVRRWRDPNGSMMGSPSSTAAYLMHASGWDDEAETYLSNVLAYGAGRGDGSVPSAWPTTTFETTWVITTLAEAKVPISKDLASSIADHLESGLKVQKGIIGFAPGILPDADDTAKALATLLVLGKSNVNVDGLVHMFEAETHFITYPGERNASFSANCNVLVCLLMLQDSKPYLSQIVKATNFLVAHVFNGPVNEKWHKRELYWMMLLSHAFALLYKNHGLLQEIFGVKPSLQYEVPMISLHLLVKILHGQQANGAWDGICEVTSYAILALASLAGTPWAQQPDIKGGIIAAMARGKAFLLSRKSEWSQGHYLWIEKVTYASETLSEAYCLAGACVPLPALQETFSNPASLTLPVDILRGMRKAGALISATPLFSTTEAYVLRAAELQACYALCLLSRNPLKIFPRTAKGKDKYLSIIPLAFAASAAAQGCFISLSVLREMMILSSLNFLVDEYMEGVIAEVFSQDLDTARNIVKQLFIKLAAHNTGTHSNGHSNGNFVQEYTVLEDVNTTLRRFVTHILHHPAVLSSPTRTQQRLANDLETFLLAHITHAEDNQRFDRQHPRASDTNSTSATSLAQVREYQTPKRTFYNWVRSTSADHTSCPFSFVFYACLVRASLTPSSSSKPGTTASTKDLFTSGPIPARTAYLAEDLCRHLATMCRIYNDLGSLNRDTDERNLNSANFPEFHTHQNVTTTNLTTSEQSIKGELLWIAEHERRGLRSIITVLEEQLQLSVGSASSQYATTMVEALKMFVNVTDLYGQIYILKDVGTRTK